MQSDFVASEFRNITFRVCSDILIFSKDDSEYGTEVCLGSHSEVGTLFLTSMILYLGVWGLSLQSCGLAMTPLTKTYRPLPISVDKSANFLKRINISGNYDVGDGI